MGKRITIDLNEELLARAKIALGTKTAKATVEEALRRAATHFESEQRRRAGAQMRYLRELSRRSDLHVLSGQMWR